MKAKKIIILSTLYKRVFMHSRILIQRASESLCGSRSRSPLKIWAH